MKIKEQLKYRLNELESNTILIHSDIMQGFETPFRNKESFLISHMEQIIALNPNLNIWMPTFNYDFFKGDPYSVNNSSSQVGVLTEYFRKNIAQWRTSIPVFSFAGTGEQPILDISNIIDPFGSNSAFHFLYEKDAILMHYGSTLQSSTIIHYAERISNCLSYRYDKLFYGKVALTEEQLIDVRFNFHVRPLGMHLDYDWDKLEKDLLNQKILTIYNEGHCKISLCKVRNLVNYWTERMTQNPLYLLDSESKIWVENLLNKLGRPFLISDFETPKE